MNWLCWNGNMAMSSLIRICNSISFRFEASAALTTGCVDHEVTNSSWSVLWWVFISLCHPHTTGESAGLFIWGWRGRDDDGDRIDDCLYSLVFIGHARSIWSRLMAEDSDPFSGSILDKDRHGVSCSTRCVSGHSQGAGIVFQGMFW